MRSTPMLAVLLLKRHLWVIRSTDGFVSNRKKSMETSSPPHCFLVAIWDESSWWSWWIMMNLYGRFVKLNTFPMFSHLAWPYSRQSLVKPWDEPTFLRKTAQVSISHATSCGLPVGDGVHVTIWIGRVCLFFDESQYMTVYVYIIIYML